MTMEVGHGPVIAVLVGSQAPGGMRGALGFGGARVGIWRSPTCFIRSTHERWSQGFTATYLLPSTRFTCTQLEHHRRMCGSSGEVASAVSSYQTRRPQLQRKAFEAHWRRSRQLLHVVRETNPAFGPTLCHAACRGCCNACSL